MRDAHSRVIASWIFVDVHRARVLPHFRQALQEAGNEKRWLDRNGRSGLFWGPRWSLAMITRAKEIKSETKTRISERREETERWRSVCFKRVKWRIAGGERYSAARSGLRDIVGWLNETAREKLTRKRCQSVSPASSLAVSTPTRDRSSLSLLLCLSRQPHARSMMFSI